MDGANFFGPSPPSIAKAEFDKATPLNPACFCRATQQSFLRLSTTPTVLRAYGAVGFGNLDALQQYSTLLGLQNIRFQPEPLELEQAWYRMAKLTTSSPKVRMDAYLAAFAIQSQLQFVTFDRDFRNFEKDGLHLRLLAS